MKYWKCVLETIRMLTKIKDKLKPIDVEYYVEKATENNNSVEMPSLNKLIKIYNMCENSKDNDKEKILKVLTKRFTCVSDRGIQRRYYSELLLSN